MHCEEATVSMGGHLAARADLRKDVREVRILA